MRYIHSGLDNREVVISSNRCASSSINPQRNNLVATGRLRAFTKNDPRYLLSTKVAWQLARKFKSVTIEFGGWYREISTLAINEHGPMSERVEKGRFYYCSIRKSGIIVRHRKFVSVIWAISISLDAINLDCKRFYRSNKLPSLSHSRHRGAAHKTRLLKTR